MNFHANESKCEPLCPWHQSVSEAYRQHDVPYDSLPSITICFQRLLDVYKNK